MLYVPMIFFIFCLFNLSIIPCFSISFFWKCVNEKDTETQAADLHYSYSHCSHFDYCPSLSLPALFLCYQAFSAFFFIHSFLQRVTGFTVNTPSQLEEATKTVCTMTYSQVVIFCYGFVQCTVNHLCCAIIKQPSEMHSHRTKTFENTVQTSPIFW